MLTSGRGENTMLRGDGKGAGQRYYREWGPMYGPHRHGYEFGFQGDWII